MGTKTIDTIGFYLWWIFSPRFVSQAWCFINISCWASARSTWLDIGQVLFPRNLWTERRRLSVDIIIWYSVCCVLPFKLFRFLNTARGMPLSSFSSFTFTYHIAVSECVLQERTKPAQAIQTTGFHNCILDTSFFRSAFKSKLQYSQSLRLKDYSTLKIIINQETAEKITVPE